MDMIQKISVLLIAVLHIWIMYVEMVLWTTPKGQKIFRIDADFANKSANLAKNQGLYNGFLAAGLLWSLVAEEPFAFQLKLFFLGCVFVAGIVGSMTASKKILYVQSVPALISIILVFLTK